MVIKTQKEDYLVKEPRSSSPRNHIWFEVLEGEDQGIRLSIPVYDSEYSEELLNQMKDLEEGDIVRVVLERDNQEENWRPSNVPKVVSKL